ncbi:hypothetical protein ASPZODRAFT_1331913 [Penicilliopsis zonata CBS 506.65]|uniref:Secreted protein n=1 Tax=Penicilliopsis zonata CBS 506.65 TaxID=1073090 RepID=A0A1L9SNL1_9EURO|nr:hypothetical protein ASPZODRAFT_1331913 [Penicilliopsis zonata CBS 506.65]OJJ48849.1 hypothetical protein ASPZODRAFT_1331913 [Penicilliopsis zonata CBS 506.65]
MVMGVGVLSRLSVAGRGLWLCSACACNERRQAVERRFRATHVTCHADKAGTVRIWFGASQRRDTRGQTGRGLQLGGSRQRTGLSGGAS